MNDRAQMRRDFFPFSRSLGVFHLIAQMTAFNGAAFITRAFYHGCLQHLMEFAITQWLENTLQRQDASNLLHSAHCKFAVIIRSCFPKHS